MRAREPNSEDAPVFIVGCTRSGTTLLRDILDRHPEQAVVMESCFFSKVWRPLRERKALSQADVRSALAALKWDGAWDRIEVEHARSDRSLGALYRCLLEEYARRADKRRFGDKTPHHILYLEQLFAIFPHARVIFMLRDPRSVHGSFLHHDRHRGLAQHDRSALGRALYWNLVLRLFLKQARGRRAQQMLKVRFEDLLHAPEQQVRRVCGFVGLEYMECLLEVGNRNSSFVTSRTKEPGISRVPLGRSAELATHARLTIELACGRFMLAEGYQPELVPARWLRRIEGIGAYQLLDAAHGWLRWARKGS